MSQEGCSEAAAAEEEAFASTSTFAAVPYDDAALLLVNGCFASGAASLEPTNAFNILSRWGPTLGWSKRGESRYRDTTSVTRQR